MNLSLNMLREEEELDQFVWSVQIKQRRRENKKMSAEMEEGKDFKAEAGRNEK